MSWLWNNTPPSTSGARQAAEREERLQRRQALADQQEELPHHFLQADIPPGIARRHSRSPSPRIRVDQQFFPPIAGNNMATAEQLNAIKEQLRQEFLQDQRLNSAFAAARDPDVIRKKPEIPSFDKGHVDIWIRRMENSYIRAGITAAKEKFAFLETKFNVDVDPKINEFLYGDPSEDNWKNFLKYLQKQYGPTKQQQASIIVDGFKRDGRRPSQYAAALDDKTKDITIDDIKKEMLLREMPVDIRRMLQERIETLTFKAAAEIADSYFDQEGRPRHSTPPQTVNLVAETDDAEHPNDDDTINAVGFRSRQQQPRRDNRPQQQRPQRGNSQSRSQHQRRTQQTKTVPFTYKAMEPGDTLCCFHERWGDDAKKCEVACSRFDERRFSGNSQAGRK